MADFKSVKTFSSSVESLADAPEILYAKEALIVSLAEFKTQDVPALTFKGEKWVNPVCDTFLNTQNQRHVPWSILLLESFSV